MDLPAQDLAHRLTMAGVEVDDIIEIGNWKDCSVGQVLDVKPHPQADRLTICRVATGQGEVEVVCGAPNVAADQKICFASVGAYLYNAHSGKHEELKPARIRGVVSQGMICSELELGLGEDHAGIMVLPEDAPVGLPLDEYMGDTILDLELTPNRLDCLSILGVAHEVAALTGQKVSEPEIGYPDLEPGVAELVDISIADPDLCHRYTASLIRGLSIGPSPNWLQERITRAGLRPINNVVDVTNYVMLELNQPLHAFDFGQLQDEKVIVRRAAPGEALVTLDGVDRPLGPDVLVIADGRRPIGIGGVIGGANTEIGPDTTDVLLESATFNSFNNRETAQAFRLRTEATLRFEKGLRPELAPIALRRATQLIQQVAGGKVAKGIVDVFPEGDRPVQRVPLTTKRLKKVLGMDVDVETVDRVLQSLGFETKVSDHSSLDATVPYWRNDIAIEEDLVEEVVRIIGYDTVPTTPLSAPIPHQDRDPAARLRDLVKDALAASGMQEIISYPLISFSDLEDVNQDGAAGPVLQIANPMSAQQEILRPTLRASLLSTLAANLGHEEGPFRLFEVGHVFKSRPNDLPREQEQVVGVLAGRRWEASWLNPSDPRAEAQNFYDAKGVLESLLGRLAISARYLPAEDPMLRLGATAQISAGDITLGVLGEVDPSVVSKFALGAQPVAFFELNLDDLLEAMPDSERQFTTLPRYPTATRDLALVVGGNVPSGSVQEIILRHRLVSRAELFDIYTGDQISDGTKSLAFHVYFQAQDRTLTNEEVDRALQGLLRNLEREVQASLRA